MSESQDAYTEEMLASALERLLACPDLNLDEIEDETRAAIKQALDALDAVKPKA